MKTNSRSRLNAEYDLICVLSCVEPRISMAMLFYNNEQAQPPHRLQRTLWY